MKSLSLPKPVSILIFALSLLAVPPVWAEEGRVVISDHFKPLVPEREAGKMLNGTKTEVGEAVWSASEPLVFGNDGLTTLGQTNEGASFPFNPSAFGLDGKPFALRIQMRFARASNAFWFGFGKGKRPGCNVVINAKEQIWKISTGEKEDGRSGSCTLNGDVNNIELRIDPASSTCDLTINGEKVAEKVPLFIDPSMYSMVNFRFFFLSRFEMTGVEVVAL